MYHTCRERPEIGHTCFSYLSSIPVFHTGFSYRIFIPNFHTGLTNFSSNTMPQQKSSKLPSCHSFLFLCCLHRRILSATVEMSSKYKFLQVARLCPVRNNVPILAITLVLPIQHQPNQPQALHSAGGPNHPVLVPTNLNTSLFLNKTLCWELHAQALLSHHLPPTPCQPGQTVAE